MMTLTEENYLKELFHLSVNNPQVSVLDPLEGLDEEGRKENLTYIKIMQRNVSNLEKALNE